MPTLKRLCTAAGCGKIAVRGSSLCAPHKARSNERAKERKREADKKRPSAKERGYDLNWRRTRGRFLKHNPMCKCGKPATEVDHIVPISQGGARLRWSNLQGMCKSCHSSKTAKEFRGEGGRFTNKWVPQEEFEAQWKKLMYPKDLPKPPCEVTIVCGPPGSGKTHYVIENAEKGDRVCDLDVIKRRTDTLRDAVKARNDALQSLSPGTRLWFVVGAPEKWERDYWSKTLGGDVVMLMPNRETCKERIRQSGERVSGRMKGLENWFKRYEPRTEDELV